MEQEDGFILSTHNKRPGVGAYMDPPPAGNSGYHSPQKKLCVSLVGSHLREISENPGMQVDGSQSYVSQAWQAAGSNSNHISNWNGGLTEDDYQNLGFDPSTDDAAIIQNSDLMGSGQLLQGAVPVEVEVNTRCLPSNQPQPVEILDNPTINIVSTSVALNQQTIDVGDAGSIEEEFCIRLDKLLDLGMSTSPSPLCKTLRLCAKVSELPEDDSKCETLVNFTKLVQTPAREVKDQCMRKKLRKKLCIWLFHKIAEDGAGASELDVGGQGVLHFLAALGYDGPIKSILKAAIINVDLPDMNQDTALDWALLMRRNSTVKLLESHDATPRSARKPVPPYSSAVNAIRKEAIPNHSCVVNPDFMQIQQMAKSNWLAHSVICEILCNHQQYPFERPTPPTSGSLFLVDTNIHRNFRGDGLTWKKEYHHDIKVEEFEFRTTYARGTGNNHLRRRWYKLKMPSSNIVLVHYLEVQASNSNSKHGSYSVGGSNADDNPDSGPEHHHYLPFGQHAVNQTTRPNDVNQMDLSNAGGMQNSYLIGPDKLHLQDALKLSHSTSTECSSESSCNGNPNVEDDDNYSSSKQVLLEGHMPDDIVVINNLDCCTSDQLEDVIEKTIQPCLDAQKGAVGSEDGDEQSTANILIFPGANTGLVTDPTPKYERTPEDLASSSGHKDISGYLAESITLQDSSRTDGGIVAVGVSEQTATPVGDDCEFGLSDDYARSFLPLMTKNAAKDSEPVHAAAVRIQNKFRSWKGRMDFLLTRQQIIKIQAHVRGHQVRVKKAFAREGPMNVASGVPEKEADVKGHQVRQKKALTGRELILHCKNKYARPLEFMNSEWVCEDFMTPEWAQDESKFHEFLPEELLCHFHKFQRSTVIHGECSVDNLNMHQMRMVEDLKQYAIRIREAMSNSFIVKDFRSNQKHYPPSLTDAVWRLEKIKKDGSLHKRLTQYGIHCVQDFLRWYETKQLSLCSKVFSIVSNETWNIVVSHARTCTLDDKRYMFRTAQGTGLLFNSIFKVVGMSFDGDGHSFESVDNLNMHQMRMVEDLKQYAYKNMKDWVLVDEQSYIGYPRILATPPDNLNHPILGPQDAHFQPEHDQLEMKGGQPSFSNLLTYDFEVE